LVSHAISFCNAISFCKVIVTGGSSKGKTLSQLAFGGWISSLCHRGFWLFKLTNE
jgi:hypothetical protein